MFFAGLMDCVSTQLPTAESIAGARLLTQGMAHIKTILVTGNQILGYRSLEADKIKISHETSAAGLPCEVIEGFNTIRAATRSDVERMITQSTWGFRVLEIIAERVFVKGKADAFGEKLR